MNETPRPTQDVLEPVVGLAPVVPIQAPRRSSRGRWAIAAIAALLIVAVSAAGLFALVGASTGSTVAKWAPADSLVYVEVRGDLPGDQRQNLGRFLAHFPGFADQSTLDQKLDETLDRLVGRASDGKHDWTKEIKPWFGGQVGVAVSAVPSVGSGSGTGGHELIIATIKDPAAATSWFAGLGGPAPTDQTYQGVTLHVVAMGGEQGAYAATAGVLLAGDLTSVKAALDRNGADGLAGVDTFQTAMANLKGDQLVRTYVDLKGYVGALKASLPASASAMPGFGAAEALARLPAWAAAGLRVDEDALAGTSVVPHRADSTATNAASKLASKVPASTVTLAEAHDLGSRIAAELERARKDPAMADAVKRVDSAAAMAGGVDALTGWIGDAGVAVVADGSRPSMGLVIVPTDPAKAAATLASVKNLLVLAGTSTGVTVHEEPYAGGTITVFDAGDVQKLLGRPDVATSLAISGHLEIAVGIRNDIVAIGLGDAFVKAVLDTKPGASLADQAGYRDALDRVGSKNAGSIFVDLAGARALAEPFIAASPQSATYQKELRPYLEPFAAFAAAIVVGDSVDSSNSVVVVSQPK